MTTLKKISTDENKTCWIELNGADYGTDCEFDHEVYGITDDNVIIDCDGIPCTEGDNNTIAVRNAIHAN